MKKQFLFIFALLFVTLNMWGITPSSVNSIGTASGWYSDDTRGADGGNLVGTTLTLCGKPGQTPTTLDDNLISQQVSIGIGPDGVAALKMSKTSISSAYSKSSISYVNLSGLASADSWLNDFVLSYRYYTTTTSELTIPKIGIQSSAWANSQIGFTAQRSGESVWDLVLVDWRGTDPGFVVNSWGKFNTDKNTKCWRLYRQAGNSYFPALTGSKSLQEIYDDTYWGPKIFGPSAKVTSFQFGVGSSPSTNTSYIDYVETNLLNGGNRVDFVSNIHNFTQNTFHATIQGAIDAATNGDEIRLANGTYNLTTTLNIDKELTITGESEAGVIINTTATPSGAWAIYPSKSNTSLSNFTIIPNAINGGYPIHAASGIALTPISNITLSHITINSAYRTPFDLNGIDNLTLSNLTAKNATRGNGIQVSGCKDVNASNLTTSGNAWGGFAVYVGKDVGRGSSNVTVDGTTSSFGEGNDVFVQDEFGYVNSNITVTGYDYLVQNSGAVGYSFCKKDKSIAYTFAAALTNPQNSSVKKISTGEYWVGSTLKIQAAVDAAVNGNIVNVDAGTYELTSLVDINKSITLQGQGRDNTTIELSSTWFNVNGPNAFTLNANDIIIKNIHFKVIGKGQGNIIGIFNSNAQIINNKFSGEYVFGDSQVTRATVWSANPVSGILMDNNIIESMRQPGYISGGSGVISNNTFNNTRGWVIENAQTIEITRNTWGSNSSHITILSGSNVAGLSVNENNLSGSKIDWAIDNRTGTKLNATCNWWGTNDYLTILPKINGNVNFLNFLTSSDLSGSCTGVGPVVNLNTGQSYMAIQPAVDAALNGQVIKVPAGTYTGDVNTTGKEGVIISIGSSPGCVTINGNVTLTSLDTYVVEIENATACTGFDKATINGDFDAGGAKLEVKVDPAYVPALASSFEIFNVSGTISGAFSATTYMSGKNRFNVAIAAPSISLVTTDPLAIDIAIYEVGCAAFKVVLKPSVTLDADLSNVQFTIKYPASVELINVVSPLGLITGTPLAASGGFKYVTYVLAPLASTGWVAGSENVVLTFNHNQLGIGTGDIVILSNAEASIATSYYTEFIGSDVTGLINANALGSWLDGCPVHNETKDLWYYKIQPAITEAASADVVRAFNKSRNSGIYPENLIIDKALTLVGPNDAISPNGGTRVPEVVILPAATKKDLITVSASDVTIKGLTLNGDNPAITSGYNGTNDADLDNYDGIYVGVDNVNNLTVQNNILQNLMYFAVDLYGAYPIANPLSTGLLIDNNLIKDLGYYTGVDLEYAKWGGGVLIYNNHYARITNNVMTNVRTGIQTGNFWKANAGSADFQVIENNTIQARRNAIFHNLHYSAASPFTLKNNTISALANTNETTWMGIRYSSLSVNSFGLNNTIDGAGVSIPSWGNGIWNVKNASPVEIKGDVIQNVSYGVFANNFEGYASNGTDGASVVVTGATIMPNATGFGIYGLDSPSYTGGAATGAVDVKAYNNKIIGGAEAIKLTETRANKITATIENNSVTGYTQAVNSNLANKVLATCNWWGTTNLSTIDSKITNANVLYTPYLSNNSEIAGKVYPNGFEPAGLCETVLPLKVWLQGPYNAVTHEMATGINAKLPTNQPFNKAPWGYPGTETLPTVIPTDVVDWVLVEARSNETDAVERAAGLLYKNGIVNVAFDNLDQDAEYRYVIYQRNHIPVMSATPVSIANYPTPLDLTVATNLYGNANPIPNKPAIEVETGVWGMIAGDVTHNGTLQYSGPGNDRGPIIARINAGVVGATMNSVLGNGYWFEDILLDSNVKYNGANNDRSPIISNLETLTGVTYLNSIYTTPVPLVNVSGIQTAPAFRNSAVSIDVENKGISLVSSETIRDGAIDNVQFTLAWNSGNAIVENAIKNSTSKFMLMPQGRTVTIDGVSHQVFVSTNLTQLPKVWNRDEAVSLMAFDDNVTSGSLWIADNEFTTTYNAMYYVSIWGEDFTGEVKAKIPTGNSSIFGFEGVRLYPNPANNGKVFVELSESSSKNAQVTVYDVNGKMLKNTNMATDGNLITIDVSAMISGIYFVKVIDRNITHNCRFIVQN